MKSITTRGQCFTGFSQAAAVDSALFFCTVIFMNDFPTNLMFLCSSSYQNKYNCKMISNQKLS